MDFVNDTPFEADIMRTVMSPEEIGPFLSVVALKITYLIEPDGTVSIDPEQIPLQYKEEETDLGIIPGDFACQKPGIDLMVLGHVYAPGGSRVKQMTVRLKVGAEEKSLLVFGDRRWVKKKQQLVVSDPVPFTTMPLSYAKAYGGLAQALGYKVPNGYNPEGKGYALEEKYTVNMELPNIEDPNDRIKTWQNQPIPAGYAPVSVSTMFTVIRGIEFDSEKMEQRVKPDVFQSAHPNLVFSQIPAGTMIRLEGMTSRDSIHFRMPNLEAEVGVELGGKNYKPPGKVDTVCIFPDERRCYLIHRTPFKYKFFPEQIRKAYIAIKSTGATAP